MNFDEMSAFHDERRELSNADGDIKAIVQDFKANINRARNNAVCEFLRTSFILEMREAGAYEAEIAEVLQVSFSRGDT